MAGLTNGGKFWCWHFWIGTELGLYLYSECIKCHKRKITQIRGGGHSPIDRDWLNTGRFTPSPTTPPQKPPKGAAR